ncbi:helix-turn-helix domain-containing protein [Paenibacillus pasadenensis]|uniref:helix-turn-helix domain-containing protein n=1 Tax=Paenibacillus pasadenensis TaxID=217090 RepID=UPI00203AFCC9|nr:helix-turn-helix domain-containing protein [Paenibacillus pasadenensis]MCM3749999.1 helix-turn-helix domain-containing protein [Paenibacillus pasadenensis]
MKILSYSSLLASAVIGISLVASSLILRDGASTDTVASAIASPLPSPAASTVHDKPLLTIAEAGELLGLTEQELRQMIAAEKSKLNRTGSFTGEMIPYIKIGNKILISRDGLMRWLDDASRSRREYADGIVTN